jgi:riboflavin biosynthesis pyrimidine reductase
MNPLELLYEVEDVPSFDLPVELGHLYGGLLGLAEPRVYTNFVATIDGVVAIPSIPRSNTVINAGSEADRFVMGLLRAFADVVLIGSGTLRSSPEGTWRPEKVFPPAAEAFTELRRRLGRADAPAVAILTGSGSIDPAHPVLESGALVLTSDPGAERLAGVLPGASTVVSLGEGPTLDPRVVVSALHEREHRLILSEAGPQTFGALLAAGVADELYLTVSPLLAGDAGEGSRLRLVEGADLAPDLVGGRMLSVRRSEAHLFLRYELKPAPRDQPRTAAERKSPPRPRS